MVNVEYVQGHNAALTRGELDDPPGNWHFRPEKVGASLILGDIGSHAHHMAAFVAGQSKELARMEKPAAEVNLAATRPVKILLKGGKK